METNGGEWTSVMADSELAEGKPMLVTVRGVDVFLYRTTSRIFALADRCTHQAGPLHRGRINPLGSHPTVTCPVHGSMFQLEDGRVLRGPAQEAQPVYQARVSDGRIEVRPG